MTDLGNQLSALLARVEREVDTTRNDQWPFVHALAALADFVRNHRETFLTALQSGHVGAVERWQPIATCRAAGQAETVIIAVTCPDRGTVVGEAWRADDGEWWWAGTTPSDYYDDPIREINFGDVTHWMPMPDAPAAIGSGGAS